MGGKLSAEESLRQSHALSGGEIKKIMFKDKKNCRIMLYEELGRLQNGRDLFKMLRAYNGIFILYPTIGKTVGHWTLLYKVPEMERIVFFDPYGKVGKKMLFPDQELMWNKSGIKYPPYLSKLLLEYPHDLEFSEYPFQKDVDKDTGVQISTCGRWCCYRLMCNKMNEKEFIHHVKHYCKQMDMTPDEYVTYITDEVLNESG